MSASGDPFDEIEVDQPARPDLHEFRPTGEAIAEPSGEDILAALNVGLSSPQRQAAVAYHQLFLDYQAAGFTADQALHLTGVAIAKQMEMNAIQEIWRKNRGDG
jgi:hypothetical protein